MKKAFIQTRILQMEPWFGDEEAEALFAYMKSGGWVMEFKKTEELEAKIAEFTGSRYCVMTVNGTIALMMALLSLGLKKGDEVLVPNLTMIASPNSASILGIKPILIDVLPDSLCLDLALAEKALTKRTQALMYVPLNGRSGDMEAVVSFCKRHELLLVEDAAQALGSFWNGKHLGTFGAIGCFSFSVPKIITTGQGGALVTDDTRIYERLKKIKDFGRSRGGVDSHDSWGWNFKFTDLQAVIGLEQMKKLSQRLKIKKAMYQKYRTGLSDLKQVTFVPTNLANTTPWFIDIYINNRDQLARYLKTQGVGTRPVYPPISSQKIYQKEYKGQGFPVSEQFAKRGLWLPSSTKLTPYDLSYIIDTIRAFYQTKTHVHQT